MKICHKCQASVADDSEICACGAWFRVENKSVAAFSNKDSSGIAQGKSVSETSLGMKWFTYWTYVHLLVTGFIGVCIGLLVAVEVAWLGGLIVALCAPYLAACWGLHKRRLWGYRLNWFNIFLNSVNALVPNSMGMFGDPITPEIATEFGIRLVVVSLVWYLPNIIYWRKRRHLFS